MITRAARWRLCVLGLLLVLTPRVGWSQPAQLINGNRTHAGATNYGLTTGTALAYILTLNAAIPGYVDGMCFLVRVHVGNAGDATLNVNARGATPLRKWSGGASVPLIAGDLTTGQDVIACYDSTVGPRMQVLSLGGGGTGGGTGNVNVSGSPTVGQLASWTDTTTITGTSSLTIVHGAIAVATSGTMTGGTEYVTVGAGGVTRTLPAATSGTNTRRFLALKVDAAAGALTLAPAAGNTLNGSATPLSTTVQWSGFIAYETSASNWYVAQTGLASSGTPSAGQLAVWASPSTLAGTSNLSVQITDLDLTAATRTAPLKVVTSPPATCTVGDMFFYAGGAAGWNVHGCTATNTWTNQQGSSPTWTGKHTYANAPPLGAAGVSTLEVNAQTLTLNGSNPSTYATMDVVRLGSPTLVGSNPGQTVTLASTLTVGGPIKSTNVTATKVVALSVPTWAASTATTAVGLEVSAPTGASTNLALNVAAGNVAVAALKTPGAAGGKKVVCVDTTTGILYASSTGVDCTN